MHGGGRGKGPGRAVRGGWHAFNIARIEAGTPLYYLDFGPDSLPHETGEETLNDRVSFKKGCYLGQEIVARMHARQQVAKQLVGLRVHADALPVAGAHLFDEKDNQVGMVTSSTVSPVLSNACIGLGYLKKPFFALGTKVRVAAEGAMREVEVVGRPFVEEGKR